MAIVQNPITGRSKNKFGTAVFSKQFGKNTMRTKPIEVKNPKTPDQVNQREKFSLMVSTARLLLNFIRVSFKNSTTKMSPYNVFVSHNLKNAIIGLPGSFEIDYPNLMVSKGTIFMPVGVVAGSELSGKVKRNWSVPLDPSDPSNSDLLVCLVYNIDKALWLHEFTTTMRSVGVYQQTVPADWSSDEVHVYTLFTDSAKAHSSDSVYSGIVTVL